MFGKIYIFGANCTPWAVHSAKWSSATALKLSGYWAKWSWEKKGGRTIRRRFHYMDRRFKLLILFQNVSHKMPYHKMPNMLIRNSNPVVQDILSKSQYIRPRTTLNSLFYFISIFFFCMLMIDGPMQFTLAGSLILVLKNIVNFMETFLWVFGLGKLLFTSISTLPVR